VEGKKVLDDSHKHLFFFDFAMPAPPLENGSRDEAFLEYNDRIIEKSIKIMLAEAGDIGKLKGKIQDLDDFVQVFEAIETQT